MTASNTALSPLSKVLWGLLASLLLIGGVWSSYGYQQSSQWENLVHQYLQESTLDAKQTNRALAPAATSSPTTEVTKLLEQLDAHIEQREAVKAIAIGNLLLELDPDNHAALLRLGLVYLQQQEYDEAQLHFKQVYEAQEPHSRPQAAWYLALLHAQYGQTERCKTLLQEVAAGDAYAHQATQLLRLFKA